jgi:hypothetical protein
MLAVVTATGLAAATPWLFHALDLNPLYSLPAAGVNASGVAQLIGEQAIRFYAKCQIDSQPASPSTAMSPAAEV